MTDVVDWRADAACVGESELFDAALEEGGKSSASRFASAFCARCPVRQACLQAALDEEGRRDFRHRHGVRGGLNGADRARLSLARRSAAA